jgi:hypothetical protein
MALQYFAASNIEPECKAKVDESSRLLEGLLTMMSSMFTLSCRNSLRSESKQPPRSFDVSIEENSKAKTEVNQMPAVAKDKLLELEQRLKGQAAQVTHLETSLENLLAASNSLSET